MAIGAVVCLLSLMLSGYATAFPRSWLTSIEVPRGTCAPDFTNGCCEGRDTACTIREPGRLTCYCDRECHNQDRDDCCDDIEAIGCLAPLTQCADAGLDPGNCSVNHPTVKSCRAHPHNCYCDQLCNDSNVCDCCDDVPNGCQRSKSLSNIQDRPITHYSELNDALKDAETIKRRLLHYLLSSQDYQRRPDRFPIAQREDVDDAEMLERRLLHYLTSSQSYRGRPHDLPMAQVEDLEVELLERVLAERAREATSKRKN